MKPALVWKIYNAQGVFEAACAHAEIAAAIVAILGEGSTIHYLHSKLVWTEGKDGEADNSYDGCAEVCARNAGMELEPPSRNR